MLLAERRRKTLEKLHDEKHVVISELSAEFKVSEETVRRDLEKLEKDGLLARTYGGAVCLEEEKHDLPYEIRKKTNIEEKHSIAQAAAELISDGDCVMLDESSTATYVAKALKSAGRKKLTVVTNSVEILLEVVGTEGWNIISTGGTLKENALAFTGYHAENMLRSYHVDVAVISCASLDISFGYTDRKEDNALIKRAMMSAAKKTVLAVDSHKFDKVSFAEIGALFELDVLVTDKAPSEAWTEKLADLGVKLIVAG